MRRGGKLAMVLAALCGCGSRTTLDLSAVTSTPGEGGVPGGSDSGPGPDSPTSADAPPTDCMAGSPPASRATWTLPVFAAPGSTLADVYAVSAADDGSLFVIGCGEFDAPGCRRGSGPCFLAKLDANGGLLFEDRFTDGINDPLTASLAADGEGGVLVALECDEGTDLGDGAPAGCVVARFDASGQERFIHPLQGADCTTSFAFAADKNAHSAIVAASPDGKGFLIVRLDGAGVAGATRMIPADVTQGRIAAAALQDDGTLLVGGYGKGAVDFGDGLRNLGGAGAMFLVTYDGALTPRASLAVSDIGTEMQAAATSDGRAFVVAGDLGLAGVDLGGGSLLYSGKSIWGGPNQDLFLAELTPTLGHVWSRAYGDVTSQDTTALCLDPNGTIGWLGVVGMETDFGSGALVSGLPASSQDGFVASIAPGGATQRAVSTETSVRGIACVPGAYVLVGRIPDLPVNLGGGETPVGGFIVRRARP